MTVVILYNPRSGSGKAQTHARRAHETLVAADIPTSQVVIGHDPPLDQQALSDARALVIVGGDGTVHGAAPIAAAAQCPIYHLPTGNENLFARAFGMTTSPVQLLNAIRDNNTTQAAMGSLQSESESNHFLLMCSLGPDAGVIHRLAQQRSRPTGHRAYTRPVTAEAFAPTLPRLTIRADNTDLVVGRKGWLIVANARQYALHLDPVPQAEITAPGLELLFIPAHTTIGATLALLSARFRPRSFIRAHATTISMTAERPTPVQIDGEASDPVRQIELSTAPTTLPVLLPEQPA